MGRISHLNMYPLYHHLDHAGGDEFAFTDGVPTALNAAVLDGRLDVSAMSSIEFARNSETLRLLPVASISAAGAVDSIQLFSNVPFEDVRSVAVTGHSATSVALLRVLLGPEPVFGPLETAPADALESVDGVLLIGDRALEGVRAPFSAFATDLGARWADLTGVPMVFGVWAVRRDLPDALEPTLDRLVELLTEAQAEYARDPGRVVRAAAGRFPFPEPFIAGYFARLRYGFGPDERRGLERFLRLARSAGELERLPALAAA
ncbi:MAG: menaquinone biosynthesis protein [Acidimicrobiales bacterium]|nr:menaquinone biosynthesis protein [Acidimicrobiales bacterium]